MNTMASIVGIRLIFALFMALVPIALLIVFQVWLCKKGRRLGLILPVLSLVMSLVLVLSMGAFSRDTGGSYQVTDEHGQVIQEEHHVETHHNELTSGAVGALVMVFLMSNIPTVVFGGIWLHYKGRRDTQDDLERMRIEDLG